MKDESRLSMLSVLSKFDDYWGDGITREIRCPICEFEYQHCENPQVIDGKDDYKANWDGRGNLIVIPVWGECGSKWEICFGSHKGYTAAFVRLITSCEETGSYVYFIEAVGLGKIKIGTSDAPKKRLQQLATGSAVTLDLIAMIPGDAQIEKELHKKFDHLRVDREWFFAAKELREYIKIATEQSA
ncbi:hypothetical protein B1R32_105129 [Abditibacterium utsteinense]|uniref:Bacteriophage T5 Orf172 DNA-binding domain-containing protein n=1 Tax=Abditibacterium utsteinense TaxID=1960156 RepID=A0A2S8SUG2_9BACT|nr:GIY-YIG nuclease family protein [Abditibacterium utsteinense]PQV64447.1 hypothetical protein B1R32_105129 [Abditibacterium utsteinense]